MRQIFAFLILVSPFFTSKDCYSQSSGTDYFVAKTGSDENPGTSSAPFLTINHAAQIAQPGDVITVREGTYREWIKPARGGNSEESRITYQAAEGEDVYILGSEPAANWYSDENGIWKFSVDTSFFDDFNPFTTLTRHPVYVTADEEGDGWGWLKYGRWTHLGDVFINRDGLIQKQTLDEVSTTALTWYSETTDSKTHIWANFGDANPNDNEVEINTRAYAFFPEVSGLSYITVKGFIIMNVASHWAPPTVYQPAAIGPNGGNHWIIEDNIILYAKGAAISIGLPTAEADFEKRGHHIVRNNVILRAGQGGITGQTWNNKSQIYGNHIEDINYRKEFGGWETAGIKHHGGDSLIIRDNFVRRIYTLSDTIGAAHGIWNDFRNSNWRVTGNVIMDTEGHSILVEANWGGPSLYENNVFANGSIGNYSTSGDAWVHNLFLNTPQSWENQPWGNRPPIENLRWVNNLFVGDGLNEAISGPDIIYANNVFTNGALPFEEDSNFILLENPIQVNIYSTDVGICLELNQTEELAENNGPLILNGYLEFPFSFDASVKDDFFKKARKKNKNLVGPFARLKNGINNLPVYEYTDLYKKAIKLLEE